MAIELRTERQSHRFHKMEMLSSKGHGAKSGDVVLNVTALVDMMMVLVIFLVMNFNASGEMLFLSKDMKMATASNGVEVTRVPIIGISYSDPQRCENQKGPRRDPNCVPGDGSSFLYFEGELIFDLKSIDMEDPDWRISELEEKLVDNRQRFEAIAADRAADLPPEEDPTTTVNVQIHQAIDFNIVKRVLYTCEQAGYGRVRLTVGDAGKVKPGAEKGGEGHEE